MYDIFVKQHLINMKFSNLCIFIYLWEGWFLIQAQTKDSENIKTSRCKYSLDKRNFGSRDLENSDLGKLQSITDLPRKSSCHPTLPHIIFLRGGSPTGVEASSPMEMDHDTPLRSGNSKIIASSIFSAPFTITLTLRIFHPCRYIRAATLYRQ